MFTSLLIHSATCLRLSASGYEDGTPLLGFVPAFEFSCRFEVDGGSEPLEQYTGQRQQVLSATLYALPEVKLLRSDRVRIDGVEGDWEVTAAYLRDDDVGPHHVECDLELVEGG